MPPFTQLEDRVLRVPLSPTRRLGAGSWEPRATEAGKTSSLRSDGLDCREPLLEVVGWEARFTETDRAAGGERAEGERKGGSRMEGVRGTQQTECVSGRES